MGDLISRQDVINKFEPWLKVEGYSEGELNMLKAILYELTVMPSAQPEQKKGKWIAHVGGKFVGFPYMHYECDQCRAFEPIETNFCPDCGADMRGEQDEWELNENGNVWRAFK